jgi:hypothetical protein
VKLRFGSMLLTDLVWRPRRFCYNDLAHDARGRWASSARLTAHAALSNKSGDDDGLSPDIMTVNLSKLSVPHHRYRFATRQSSPRGMETCRSRAQADKALDTPVVSTMLLRYAADRCGAIGDHRFSYLPPLWDRQDSCRR